MLLDRRNFLKGALAGGGSLLTLEAGALRQLAFAAAPETEPRILVVVHMRGACDGLNLLCPANDRNLVTARPAELRVLADGDLAGHALKAAASPNIDWRLHPAAADLAELYKSGALAFVHAAGIPEANRSHFVATDIMDHGAADGAALAHVKGGWLARYLAQSKQKATGLPGVSASGSLAGEFGGFDGAFSAADLANGVPLPWDGKSAAAIERLYKQAPGAAGAAGARALEAAKLVSDKLPRASDGKFAPYLDQKEGYDKTGDLGRGLRTVARLIKLDVGLTAASVDIGGWESLCAAVPDLGFILRQAQRLSWLSSGLPWLLISEDGVEDGEELSCDCNESGLLRLTGRGKTGIKGFQDGIEPCCDHRRHE